MIKELRQAIIQQLQTLSDRARIVGDDTEGEAGAKSQVRHDYILRVGYSNSTFEQPTSTEQVPLQKCDRSFQISVEIRDLRNEDKATDLLEAAEGLMIGFCPCVAGVAGEFYLTGDRFERNQDGIYYYVINLSISCFLLKE